MTTYFQFYPHGHHIWAKDMLIQVTKNIDSKEGFQSG